MKSNNSLYKSLLFAQLFVTFWLGIFGNKLADAINTTLTAVIIAVGILIIISYAVTVYFLRSEQHTSLERESPPDESEIEVKKVSLNIKEYLPNRIITLFPIGILLGIITGYTTIQYFPNSSTNILVWYSFGGVHLYELIGIIFIFLLLLAMSLYKKDRELVLALGFGFALGMSNTTLVLESGNNRFLSTILGWFFTIIFIEIILRTNTIKGFISDVSSAFNNLTKER